MSSSCCGTHLCGLSVCKSACSASSTGRTATPPCSKDMPHSFIPLYENLQKFLARAKMQQPETDAPMSPQQKPQNHPAGCTMENTHFPNLRKSSQRGQEDKSNHSTDTFSNNLSFYLSFCLNFLIKSIFHIFDLPLMNNHINYSRHFFFISEQIFFSQSLFFFPTRTSFNSQLWQLHRE